MLASSSTWVLGAGALRRPGCPGHPSQGRGRCQRRDKRGAARWVWWVVRRQSAARSEQQALGPLGVEGTGARLCWRWGAWIGQNGDAMLRAVFLILLLG